MTTFKVTGDIDPFLQVSMKQGERIYCESNAMVMMDSTLELKGKMRGGLGGALMRSLANGESFFQQNIEATGGDGKVRFGDVVVDIQNRRVTKGGVPVRLTPTEHRLLAVLVANAGKVMTTPQLLRNVWGPNQADHAHYLRIYMGHLRHKLEDNPAQPRYMITETGVGYRFQLPSEVV